MERYVCRMGDYVYYTKGKYPHTTAMECDSADVRNLLNRVADYEDSGLEPNEIAEIKLKAEALDSMGEFGKLFIPYKGCPRGAPGRQCAPVIEELQREAVITDVDGGRWRPVNEDALREAVALLKLVEMNGLSDLEAENAAASADDNFSNYKIQLCYASEVFQENESILRTPQFIRYMLAESVLREAKRHIVFSERKAGKHGSIKFSARLLIAVEEAQLRK